MSLSRPGRAAAALLAGLAVFSLLYSVGHAVGLWRGAAPAGLARVDLAAGVLFGIGLLVTLVARRSGGS